MRWTSAQAFAFAAASGSSNVRRRFLCRSRPVAPMTQQFSESRLGQRFLSDIAIGS